MKVLPSLDAHAHFNPTHTADELAESGAVLAMTLSLEEAALVIGRSDTQIAWGVGCYPRKPSAQESFNVERFRGLAERTAVVGEIGLDTGLHYTHARLETQLGFAKYWKLLLISLESLASIAPGNWTRS